MNIINASQRSYIAMLSAILMLFVSCNQYDEAVIEEQSFDYSAFHFLKTNNEFINSFTFNKSKSSQEISQEILNNINRELGTNVTYPEQLFDLFDQDMEYILNKSLENGWISQYNIDLSEEFLENLTNFDFDYALEKFEQNALALNLPIEEFQKLNIFANTIKSINLQTPELFRPENLQAKGFWSCAGATFALTVATAGLSSCATLVACAGAVALHLIAFNNFGNECLSELEPSGDE